MGTFVALDIEGLLSEDSLNRGSRSWKEAMFPEVLMCRRGGASQSPCLGDR
jgi:hypothetical protein